MEVERLAKVRAPAAFEAKLGEANQLRLPNRQ